MANINIRIDDKLKNKVLEIFDDFGLNMTTGIRLYLKTVVRTKSIPFDFEIQNKDTRAAFKELEEIESGRKKVKTYTSIADLRKDLGV